ncbi:MAG: hypothetical protein SFZ23_13985 [Planctomycetota bacterium]|nr:hypothetical protein [Planctomycetota bacterium]
MRSLGEFVGHVVKGVRTKPGPTTPAKHATSASKVAGQPAEAARTHTVRRDVEEREQETPDARVVLRRTVIEEVEIRPREDPPAKPR